MSHSPLVWIPTRWRSWLKGSANARILGAAITIAGFSVLVGVAVALKDLFVAYRFGTSDEVDAFVIAWLLPAFSSYVVADSLSAAFVPAFVGIREDAGLVVATGVFRAVLGRSVSILLLMSLVLAASSPWVLPWIGGRFDHEKLALTERLFLILLPALFLNGLATIWSSVLNAGERFALTSLVPIAVPVGAVLGLIVFGKTLGIVALAVGTTFGYFVKAVWLAAAVRKRLGSCGPSWIGHRRELKEMASQYLPTACGAFLMASTQIIDQTMGARLGAGTVASLTYGMKIVTFALGLASLALGTALLPHLSTMVARSEWRAVRRTITVYARLALGAGALAALVLYLMSDLIVRLVYQRGAFTPTDAAIVSRIMAFNALQIPFFLLGTLLVRLAFALRRSSILLLGTLISVPLNIALNWIFIQQLGPAGIALSTSCVYLVSAAFLSTMLLPKLPVTE